MQGEMYRVYTKKAGIQLSLYWGEDSVLGSSVCLCVQPLVLASQPQLPSDPQAPDSARATSTHSPTQFQGHLTLQEVEPRPQGAMGTSPYPPDVQPSGLGFGAPRPGFWWRFHCTGTSDWITDHWQWFITQHLNAPGPPKSSPKKELRKG